MTTIVGQHGCEYIILLLFVCLLVCLLVCLFDCSLIELRLLHCYICLCAHVSNNIPDLSFVTFVSLF